jgi:hypothetical protein
MRERPILFSDPMVRAILAGRKTQTRRLATQRHFSEELHARALAVGVEAALLEMPDPPHVRSPFGAPGDLLWVRECFACPESVTYYRADEADLLPPGARWTPSIHMPRWASRLTLLITSMRVERLQAIAEEDARAEGVAPHEYPYCADDSRYRMSFARLWDSLAAEGSRWSDDPWVWVVGFERVEVPR